MDSILNSVKKLLGITPEYTDFDIDLIIHINSVFMILNQIGVGPDGGFSITSSTETWSEYLGDDYRLESVKSYMYAKVRMMFDPPQNGALSEALNNVISELEFRLSICH